MQQRLLGYEYDSSQLFLDSDGETGIPAGSKWEEVLYARFIPQNIVNELGQNGISDVANAIFANRFDTDAIPNFVHSIIYEPFQKRAQRKRLSG